MDRVDVGFSAGTMGALGAHMSRKQSRVVSLHAPSCWVSVKKKDIMQTTVRGLGRMYWLVLWRGHVT
jgi:hypothetical protein